jgi:hypothetical protein
MTVGVLCGLLGLAGVTVWLLARGDEGAGIANVLALPLTVVGTAAAVYGLRARPRADDIAVLAGAARFLLKQVIAGEERALQQLLGDTGRPRPADVGFDQPEAAVLRWRDDGGDASGTLETVAAYYRRLTVGRLVVLGEAGAGKTVLVLRLLIDLATAAFDTIGAEPHARVRVPVRLSLPALTLPGGVADAAAVRANLDGWLVAHLAAVYGIKPAVSAVMIADGWILPVLDGLDEMDADDGPPERARHVLAGLNHAAGPACWPVVLTCRTNRYHQLSQPQDVLQDATAIRIRPLDVEQVVAWLAHRFPGRGQPDRLHQRWRRVATVLRTRPGGRLATCLTTPLYLYLAAVAYGRTATKPRILCDLDDSGLRQHLLDALIPALTEQHRGPDGRYHDAGDVRRWLRYLADHLARMAALGRSSADIHLHDLWRTAGRGRRIRYQAAFLVASLVVSPVIAFVLLYAAMNGFTPSQRELVSTAMVLALLTIVVTGASRPMTGTLRTFDLASVRTPAGRRNLASGVAGGLACGLGTGLALSYGYGLSNVVVFGLPLGLALGLAGGLVFGLSRAQHAAKRPSTPLLEALTRDLFVGLAFGLPSGLVLGLAVGLESGVDAGPGVGVLAGSASGLSIGIAAAFTRSAWPRYVLAVRRSRRRDELPRRPTSFVDWAHTAGLLRLAGTAIQFRHRDLQTHLVTASQEQPGAPMTATRRPDTAGRR